MASRAKKENVILLPNKDKLPLGKIKDFNKFLNMVSAEYGIEDDLKFFVIEKEKYMNIFKLQFIPRTVTQLKTDIAKKFVIFELSRMGYDCLLKTDDELNKRVLVINNLINTISSECKETVTCKLNTMLDAPGELDALLYQLISDPQYNSFKYTVLDNSKNSCLLCVNGDGLFVRSLESPFDVIKQLSWQDIISIKSKGNRLIFLMKHEKNDEIICINKKTVSAAHGFLVKYLSFVDKGELCDIKPEKTSWFGSLRMKIRQSFTKRPKTHDSEPHTSYHTSQSKSTSTRYRENAPSNSIVPGSSIVSEDCMDNIGSLVEPSIKTNSTHDVSLGSANSFRPGVSPGDQQHQSSLARLSGPDDHMSVKTTSTYEVNLDCGTSPRSISTGARSDHDSTGFAISSFGQSQQKKSPPLSQLKGNILSHNSVDNIEETINPSVETMKQSENVIQSKVVELPPIKPPLRTCEIQPAFQSSGYYPQFDEVKLSMPPPLPIRSTTLEEHKSLITEEVFPLDSLSSENDSLKNSPEKTIILNDSSFIIPQANTSSIMTEETSKSKVDVNISEEKFISLKFNIDAQNVQVKTISKANDTKVEDTPTIFVADTTLSCNISPLVSLKDSGTATTIPKELRQEDKKLEFSVSPEIESVAPSNEVISETYLHNSDNKSKPNETANLSTKENVVEKTVIQSVKVESKLPVSQKKSIPSPKIQRISRIGSASSSKEVPSPTSSPTLIIKELSPSDKENYHSSVNTNGSKMRYPDMDDPVTNKNSNFSRFENEEYVLDSKTTITSVSTVGDSITKKSTKTEVSSVKGSGIPAPKQYKTTTTITSTVKKQPDASKSPMTSPPKSSGIPRMASK